MMKGSDTYQNVSICLLIAGELTDSDNLKNARNTNAIKNELIALDIDTKTARRSSDLIANCPMVFREPKTEAYTTLNRKVTKINT